MRFAVVFDVHANLEAVRGNPTATAILGAEALKSTLILPEGKLKSAVLGHRTSGYKIGPKF